MTRWDAGRGRVHGQRHLRDELGLAVLGDVALQDDDAPWRRPARIHGAAHARDEALPGTVQFREVARARDLEAAQDGEVGTWPPRIMANEGSGGVEGARAGGAPVTVLLAGV